jgi:hypothetical protein
MFVQGTNHSHHLTVSPAQPSHGYQLGGGRKKFRGGRNLSVVGSYGTRNIVGIGIISYMGATDRLYCIVSYLSSLFLSEFSCQEDSPNPVVYSPDWT